MAMHRPTDKPPQTSGEAIANGWDYLAMRCFNCERQSRVMFLIVQHDGPIDGLVRRIRCRRCNSREVYDLRLGRTRVLHDERAIKIEGTEVVRRGKG